MDLETNHRHFRLFVTSLPVSLSRDYFIHTSYQKLVLRGGVSVGGQTTQDIIDFHEDHRLAADSNDDDGLTGNSLAAQIIQQIMTLARPFLSHLRNFFSLEL